MRPPGSIRPAASSQNSGSLPAIDRTASNPAATRPCVVTTCIDRMQASGVKVGWIVRTSTAVRSTGSITWSGSAAVTSAIEARHRGQAPSKRTQEHRLIRALSRAAQPRPGNKRQVRREHRQGEFGQSRAHHGDPQVQAATPASRVGAGSVTQINTG